MAAGSAGGGISRGRAGEMFAVPVAVGRQGALNNEDIMKLMDICAVSMAVYLTGKGRGVGSVGRAK